MLESIIMLGKGDFPGAHMFDDVIDMGTIEQKLMVEGYAKTVQFDDPIGILFTSVSILDLGFYDFQFW